MGTGAAPGARTAHRAGQGFPRCPGQGLVHQGARSWRFGHQVGALPLGPWVRATAAWPEVALTMNTTQPEEPVVPVAGAPEVGMNLGATEHGPDECRGRDRSTGQTRVGDRGEMHELRRSCLLGHFSHNCLTFAIASPRLTSPAAGLVAGGRAKPELAQPTRTMASEAAATDNFNPIWSSFHDPTRVSRGPVRRRT